VHIQPVPRDRQVIGRKDTHGAMVASVVEDSPAAVAGLQPGDVIVSTKKDVNPSASFPWSQPPRSAGRGRKVWRDAHDRPQAKITDWNPRIENRQAARTSRDERATLGILLEPISEAPAARPRRGCQGVLVASCRTARRRGSGRRHHQRFDEAGEELTTSPWVTETRDDSSAPSASTHGAFRFVALPV
jgi:hypothetical protein